MPMYYALPSEEFQFHKGTIKTMLHTQQRIQPKLFQFHKGTIKTQVLLADPEEHHYFKSIKVRLKRTCDHFRIQFLGNFNSIKVRLKPSFLDTNKSVSEFQFHKGTIKTTTSLVTTFSFVMYFNSIKVRLKQLCKLAEWCLLQPFQFHKGTIKTWKKVSVPGTGTVFQFHKGTIKTCPRQQSPDQF